MEQCLHPGSSAYELISYLNPCEARRRTTSADLADNVFRRRQRVEGHALDGRGLGERGLSEQKIAVVAGRPAARPLTDGDRVPSRDRPQRNSLLRGICEKRMETPPFKVQIQVRASSPVVTAL